ncbi:CBS domain-containing protein [Aestuariirhabdus sp. Z084]|uniref:CBS domain-containing protein n=1 Tax=Aestuariirhabdus haliotis TaxID=2918751 RepID=UPI00201B453B|nr:CBS domain-containing protein [Aestuariirhabdus haliotis]MCL6416470.1 CBS domain-containing protein [Aestuariirhabdus haliotis]MCL6420460.1 CBS domain-containing protein [Aestuariirhabdus haliotis]
MTDMRESSLFQLAARQLMTPDVLSVSANWDIPELASFFAEYKLSGAPVLNQEGELVGVVSITDILRYSNNPQYKDEVVSKQNFYNEQSARLSDQVDDLEFCGQRRVSDIMTAQIIAVDAGAGVEEITQVMATNNIHRIFVTEDDQIIGIVSSMDVVRLVYQAAKASA